MISSPLHDQGSPPSTRWASIAKGKGLSPSVRMAIVGHLLLMAGCAGYQVGAETMFRSEVRTVHVPVFQSNSLRRHFGERLTEAVAKRIDTTSSYRLATATNADSVLNARLVYDRKAMLAEDRFDAPRNLEAKLMVEVEWIDRNGLPLMQLNSLVVPGSLLAISQSENFVPESGQSLVTAQQKAIERLADQIVSQMEVRW